MKIIITGGAGYIGSHALKILHAYGHETLVVDNLSTGHKEFIKWGDFEEVDICDLEKLKLIFNSYKADGVLHFAASSIVSESFERPLKILENNIYGSLNVFEAMKYSGVKNIVFSSSCSVYGIPSVNPIKENTPKNPISPYGESKLFIENALDWFDKAKILKYVVLRYFNAAGADPDGELGEDHNPETHLIPSVIDAAIGINPCFELYGTTFPTNDGTCIRDYIHVTDLAHAHVLALKKLISGHQSMSLNLGTGKGYSVMEIIKAVKNNLKTEFDIVKREKRLGDVSELIADPSMAIEYLGWSPEYSDLESIIQTACEWKKSNSKT
jgi:UDP-glucose-4-epimerase GalE